MLQQGGATVFGIEPVAANRAHARSLGIPGQHLFEADPLPDLPHEIDLWLFQDSFEHIPDPNRLTQWMARYSSPRAYILLVAPNADALSRKMMGPLWLHNVPDHVVYYSRAGVGSIFASAGFRILKTFRPLKLISLTTVWHHLRLLARRPAPLNKTGASQFCFWFNLGEMGLLLQRDDH